MMPRSLSGFTSQLTAFLASQNSHKMPLIVSTRHRTPIAAFSRICLSAGNSYRFLAYLILSVARDSAAHGGIKLESSPQISFSWVIRAFCLSASSAVRGY